MTGARAYGRIVAEHSHVEGPLCIAGAYVVGSFALNCARLGEIVAEPPSVYDPHTFVGRTLDLQSAEIRGDCQLTGAIIADCLKLACAKIRGNLICSSDRRRTKAFESTNRGQGDYRPNVPHYFLTKTGSFRDMEILGQADFEGARILESCDFRAIRVKGHLSFVRARIGPQEVTTGDTMPREAVATPDPTADKVAPNSDSPRLPTAGFSCAHINGNAKFENAYINGDLLLQDARIGGNVFAAVTV
jgi:hypothetical protein